MMLSLPYKVNSKNCWGGSCVWKVHCVNKTEFRCICRFPAFQEENKNALYDALLIAPLSVKYKRNRIKKSAI